LLNVPVSGLRIFLAKPLASAKEDRYIEEIEFPLAAVEAKKVSPVVEVNKFNPDEDRVLRRYRNEPPELPVVTKMVSCSSCVWG
jgi:hypothetical protein